MYDSELGTPKIHGFPEKSAISTIPKDILGALILRHSPKLVLLMDKNPEHLEQNRYPKYD